MALEPVVARGQGYAVLLPDPALSTGYGQEFIQRGWGEWGKKPFTDLMAITDAVVARPDIDESRTAAMGGSFGGYMANWVAGQTDRFKAIVTHASLWALDQFGPHHRRGAVLAQGNDRGDGNGKLAASERGQHQDAHARHPRRQGLPRAHRRRLRLWYELLSSSQLPADDNGQSPHRFLYFPDENHWVLQPQHAKVWYGVVEHFLAKQVLGEEVALPEELGGLTGWLEDLISALTSAGSGRHNRRGPRRLRDAATRDFGRGRTFRRARRGQ